MTGASRGIGRATAELLAQNGYNVVINFLQAETAAYALRDSLAIQGFRADVCRADVSKREDADRLAAHALSVFGGIDVLINNAGIAQQKLFTDITDSDWARLMEVDVGGVFHCCQAVLPTMLAQKSGKIINVSSIWGICGASCEVHYSAAKAAVIGLTKALAKELGPSGIQVNCVAPGIIDTGMNNFLTEEETVALKEETPLGKFGTVTDAANSILFFASDKADFLTGQVLSPNGGFVI